MTRIAWIAALACLVACGDDDGGDDDVVVDASQTPTVDADPNAPDAPIDAAGTTAADAPTAGGMSFFVTSIGNGAAGGNLGGLAGADARCATLASNAGSGRTWRAYLSTSPLGPGETVDARDRIGTGPWFNADDVLIAANLTNLHTNGVNPDLMIDESGNDIPNTEHDLVTGTGPDGRVTTRDNGDMATCLNWTSNSNDDYGWVGHADEFALAWADAHETRCSQQGMIDVNGRGRFMCFAID